MAKRIKAIKCPQCGSTNKNNAKEKHYICRHCQTEYFLDNDDIRIVHFHQHSVPTKQKPQKTTSIPAKFIMLLLLVFGGILFYVNFQPKGSSQTSSQSLPFLQRASESQPFAYHNAQGELNLVVLGLYKNKETNRYHLIAKFFDIQGKLLEKQSFPDNYAYSDNIRFKQFSSGEIYAIVNKKRLFLFEQKVPKFVDKTDELDKYKEFAAGLVSIEADRTEDDLKVVTRSGKTYCFYPISQTLIAKEKCYQYFVKHPPKGQISRAFFDLVRVGEYYKLIKFTKRYKPGNLSDLVRYRLNDVLADSRLSDATRKKSWEKTLRKDYQITDVKNFTPDRIYFEYFIPVVLYSDSEMLVIQYQLDNNRGTPQYIQALNPDTAEVLWTTDISQTEAKSIWAPYKAFIDDSHVVVATLSSLLVLDRVTGEFQHYFNRL